MPVSLFICFSVTLGANDLGGGADPILSVVSAGHALHVFVNGQLQGKILTCTDSTLPCIPFLPSFKGQIHHYLGSVYGSLEKPQLSFSQKVPIRVGINKISLLSVAVGLAVSFTFLKFYHTKLCKYFYHTKLCNYLQALLAHLFVHLMNVLNPFRIMGCTLRHITKGFLGRLHSRALVARTQT